MPGAGSFSLVQLANKIKAERQRERELIFIKGLD
jgi:hypothetical protein